MKCPNCQLEQNIADKDFGALYTCANCQAVYFINFEGNPEYAESSSEVQQFEEHQKNQAIENLESTPYEELGENPADLSQSTAQPMTAQPIVNPTEFAAPPLAFEPLESQSIAPPPTEPDLNALQMFTQYETNQIEADQSDVNQSDVNQSDVNQSDVNQSEMNQKNTSSGFGSAGFNQIAKEILDFGNSELQTAKLHYTLKVSGLDSAELLMKFREVIEDEHFAWDAAELMRSIKNGEVLLEQLNPVKAFVLVNRLQLLDVDCEWSTFSMY